MKALFVILLSMNVGTAYADCSDTELHGKVAESMEGIRLNLPLHYLQQHPGLQTLMGGGWSVSVTSVSAIDATSDSRSDPRRGQDQCMLTLNGGIVFPFAPQLFDTKTHAPRKDLPVTMTVVYDLTTFDNGSYSFQVRQANLFMPAEGTDTVSIPYNF